MRVENGTMTEIIYSQLKQPLRRRTMPTGEVSSLKGPLGLHALQNNSQEKAISIHIYSPPCLEVSPCSQASSVTPSVIPAR
jgi:hypothetical protein